MPKKLNYLFLRKIEAVEKRIGPSMELPPAVFFGGGGAF